MPNAYSIPIITFFFFFCFFFLCFSFPSANVKKNRCLPPVPPDPKIRTVAIATVDRIISRQSTTLTAIRQE